MKSVETAATDNRRIDPRIVMDEQVTITFSQEAIVGPGQNISSQGLFFVAETAIPVRVRIAGVDQPVAGELVRVQAMGEGKLGIAVRFVGATPELPES